MNIFNNKINNLNCHEDKELCIILCTTPDKESAFFIAKGLLKKKLATCITLLPDAISLYYQQTTLIEKDEIQLIIKSNIKLKQFIFDYIKKRHPYETPELLILSVIDSDKNYSSWINKGLKQTF